MNPGRISVKRGFLLICGSMAVSMLAVCAVLFVLMTGVLLTACALIWLFLLMLFFGKRLAVFTEELCRSIDRMISEGEEPVRAADRETLFARIHYRLSRLCGPPVWKSGRFAWKRKTAS